MGKSWWPLLSPVQEKKSANEAGEMVRQLGAFTLPAEGPWVQFLALTRWLQVILTFSSRAWQAPFSGLCGNQECTRCTYIHAGKAFIYIQFFF